jgi:hypothetical protein
MPLRRRPNMPQCRHLASRDPEALGICGEVFAAVVLEPSEAIEGRGVRRARAPVFADLTSQCQPVEAAAALLEVPLVPVLRIASPAVQPLAPTGVDRLALVLVHVPECHTEAPGQAADSAPTSPLA